MGIIQSLILEIGQIGLWAQAVGLLIIIWITIQIITIYFNHKRRLILTEIEKRLKRVEHKIDKLIK